LPVDPESVLRLKEQLEDELHMRHSGLTDAFRKHDEDKSGTISKAEVTRTLAALGLKSDQATLNSLFDKLDMDGNGEITLAEFQKALGGRDGTQTDAVFGKNDTQVTSGHVVSSNFAGGQVLMNDNLRHMKQSQMVVRSGLQENKTRTTDKAATSEQLQQYQKLLQEKIYTKYKELTKAFRALDEDHSGYLSKDEIVAAVSNFNLDIPVNHVQQMVDGMVDKNGDGMVEYDEFASALKIKDMQEMDLIRPLGFGRR